MNNLFAKPIIILLLLALDKVVAAKPGSLEDNTSNTLAAGISVTRQNILVIGVVPTSK